MKEKIKDTFHIRPAIVKDAKSIQSLINKFAAKDAMLPRSLNEIYESIRDYVVCTENDRVIGVAALHILWEDLSEVRSIAISNKHQGKGFGKKLVKYCLKQAKALGAKRVFSLTYFPEFFRKLGFEDIDKNDLPHKIWGDCLKCPKFPDCTEEAVIFKLDV